MLRLSQIAALVIATSTTSVWAGDQWSWRVVPYALAPNIDGDVSLGRLSDDGVNVNPADIIDVLDLGAMIFFEGLHDSGWGFMLDYSFMDLGDNGSFAGGAGEAEADIFQGTLNAFAFNRLIDDSVQQLDAYAGIRWWNMEVDVDATLGPLSRSVSIQEDWVDPHIGLRYRRQMNNSDWSFLGMADVGGFGVSSDFAWTAEAGFAWQANDTLSIEMTYKAIGVDYETGTEGTSDYFAYDTVTHGPKVGFSFDF